MERYKDLENALLPRFSDFGYNKKIKAILKFVGIDRMVRVIDPKTREDVATDEQRKQGLDIADFLLMKDTPQMILQRMIDKNPVLQKLIDELDLVLVDES